MRLSLPWPPTVNTYWRRVGTKTILSAQARQYRANVIASALEQKAQRFAGQKLQVTIEAFPPDRRARDLDNLPKGILDSLQHARVIDDDGNIDRLTIARRAPAKPGRVIVHIEVIP